MERFFKFILMLVLVLLIGSIFVVFGALYHSKKYERIVEPTHQNTTGLIEAHGKGLYDKDGNEIIFEGTNLGALFVTEGWLVPYSINDPTYNELNEPQYETLSEDQYLEALNNNANLTSTQIESIKDTYYTNWITKDDIKNIKDLGMNCVRIPFGYKMFLNDDLTLKDESSFKYLDRIIEWCSEYELYVILDLHTTPGSHNGYEHSGSLEYASGMDGCKYINFWDNEEYINSIINLWQFVSNHYKNNPTVAMYDILNEPRNDNGMTDKVCHKVMDRIYQAIRKEDDNHVIIIEGCWTFLNTPNPSKYGWENVCYSYHWYNFSEFNWTLFYVYEDFFNILRDYDTPVLIGEFNFFDDENVWLEGLNLFKERHYSWTNWTYKKVVSGYWNDSWSLYNLKMYNDETNEHILKVNVSDSTYEEIIEAFSLNNLSTANATKSSTYNVIEKYFNK